MIRAVLFDGYGTLFSGGMDKLYEVCQRICDDHGRGPTSPLGGPSRNNLSIWPADPSALATPDMAGISSLTVMTHDSFAVREGLISDFENENNVAVTFLRSGDSGAALNRAILSKEAPMADVFYGVDNTFLSRALYADIFEPYDSPVLSKIPTVYQLDEGKRALPVDYGDVCLNYDRAYFEQHGLAVPQSLEDLIEPSFIF